MANYRLGIEINADSSGFRVTMADATGTLRELGTVAKDVGVEATESIDSIGGSAGEVVNTFESLRDQVVATFAAFEAANAIDAGLALADAYGEMGARLGNAIGQTLNLAEAQNKVFAVAIATRTELSATSDAVGVFAKGFRDVGVQAERSLTKALGLTTTINQAIQVSGTSAETAADGLRQLIQGLGTGVVRGDELNSVMEAMPRLAQAIADGMGVSKSALKAMGEEGLLTRDRIVKALEGQADRIAAEYARMPSTIAGAMTNLTSSFTKFVGETNQATGATKLLAGVVQLVANNMGLFGGLAIVGVFTALSRSAGVLGGVLVSVYQAERMGVIQGEALRINAVQTAAALNLKAQATLATAEAQLVLVRTSAGYVAGSVAERAAQDAVTAAKVRATAATATLTAAQAALSTSSFTAAIRGWSASLLAFVGGPLGLLTVGLIAIPLLFSAFSGPATDAASSIDGVTAKLQAFNAERERMATTARDLITEGMLELQVRLDAIDKQKAKLKELEAAETAAAEARLQGVSSMEAAVLGLAEEEFRANEQRSRGNKSLVEGEAAARKLASELTKLTLSQTSYGRAALMGFEQVKQSGFGVVGVLDLIRTGYANIFKPASLADFDAQLKAMEKQIRSVAQTTADGLLRAQGKNVQAERLRELREAMVAAGQAVPKLLTELEALNGKAIENEAATQRLLRAKKEEVVAVRDAAKEHRAGVKDLEQIAQAQANWSQQVESLAAQLAGPAAQAALRHQDAIDELTAAYHEGDVELSDYVQLLDLLTESRRRETEEATKQRDILGQINEDYAESARLAAMTVQQRRIEEEVTRRLADAERQWGVERSAAMEGSIRASVTAGEAQLRFATDARQAAEQYERYWQDVAGSVSDAIGDALTRSGDSLKDFARSMGQIAQRIIADWIAQFSRKIILNLQVNASGGGGGGGIVNSIAGLFNGGQGGAPSSLLSTLGSAFSGVAAAAGTIGATTGAAAASSAFAGATAGSSAFAGATASASAGVGGSVAAASAIPVVGQVIAVVAAVAALVSLFKKDKPPDIRLGGVGVTRKPENTFVTAFGSSQIGVRGGTSSNEFQQLVTQFDASMLQLVGSFSGGQVQLDAIKTRLAAWSVDLKGSAVTAENVLGSRFTAILSTFSTAVQDYVGTAGDLATRTERLANAGFIEAAAASGELLGTFDGLVRVLGSAKLEGESMTQTYERLFASVNLLRNAMEPLKERIGGTEEELIKFSASFVSLAGGLQEASSLWDTFYAEFYTAEERAESALTRAVANRAKELADVGLEAGISNAAFREQFLAALPNLTPEQLNQWLQASAAINAANTAQTAYNETLTTTADRTKELIGVLGQVDAFAATLDGAFTTLRRAGLSDIQLELLGVNDELLKNVASLQRLRAAAVEAGASSQQLAFIDQQLARAHQLAAEQAAAAIERLRNAGRSLVSQLYGPAQTGQVQSAAQGFASAGVSAFEEIGQAAQAVYQAQLSGLQQIQQWLDAQRLGDTSSLTPSGRFNEAQSQFDATLALARGGDTDALSRITGIADALLREGRGRYASGQQYTDLEASVRRALAALVSAGPTGAGAGTGAGAAVGGAISGAAQEFGQQATTNRLELAQQLSGNVASLINATRDSLRDIAASLGLNVGALVTDLGVNLGALTGATTANLGSIANTLGIELAELATNVGVDLGALADDQSLLNDALEVEIGKLPAAQRDQLQGLLDAVEDAADDPEGLRAAKLALEAAIIKIGGDTRTALAPYFDDIDPTDPLNEAKDLIVLTNSWLEGIFNSINAASPAPTVQGSFAVGTAYVPRDMLAQIHQGEAVVDASTMASLRKYGIPVSGGSGSDTAAAIRALGDRLDARLVAVETAVRTGAIQTVHRVGELVESGEFIATRYGAGRTM